MNLIERDRRHLWHPYTQEKIAPLPIPIVAAKGVWLETEDGRKILDGISSWWVNILGHSHPILNQALSKQAETLEHVMFAGFTHQPAVELAEKLINILPAGLTKVFYSDNGSTAVEVALKMAYQFWRNKGEDRKTFVALENAYHGDTFGAMAASAESSFTNPFKSLLFNVLRATTEIESIEKILKNHQSEIAAVIVEPILQAAGGMVIYSAEFLKQLRQLCDKHQILLIADEVMTGFGRTGKMFACEHAGIEPDLICLSKALTNGYLPLGVTVATEEIYQAFYDDDRAKTFFHGHSMTANPLACAVACASLDLFHSENCLDKVAFINRKFHQRLPQLIELECVADVRIIGAIGIVELKSSDGYLANIGQILLKEFLNRKILLRPLGNVLYFMPPYVIEETELNWVLDEIEIVLRNL